MPMPDNDHSSSKTHYITKIAFINMDTQVLSEGAELKAESGKTYLAVQPMGQENVWTGVDKDDYSNIVILKSPSEDDTGVSWPQFQHEMVMHQLFKESSSIRKQVDRVAPDRGTGSQPVMVLEMFQATLWHARTKRPFTKQEIKEVARAILQGLLEVHATGLVYVDLKMQNVMLDGFDAGSPGDGVNLVTKLGDLGIVMEPAVGKAQPVAYRAPEVFFRGVISQAADIWAFGLIYCHLLEAQGSFSQTGMYDNLDNGSGSMFEREQAMRNALANDYDLRNVPYYKDCPLPPRDESHKAGSHWEALREHGLDEEDIKFLQWVLRADPRERPAPQTILDSHWLQDNPMDVQSTLDDKARNDQAVASGTSTSTAAAPVPEHEPTQAPTAESQGEPETSFDRNGSDAFDTLLENKEAIETPASPVKDHPLVAGAMAQATDEETDDAADQESSSNTASKKRAGSDAAGPAASSAVVDPPQSKRPNGGGTYLSYR